jgi:acyl carrier protein
MVHKDFKLFVKEALDMLKSTELVGAIQDEMDIVLALDEIRA